MSDPALHRVHLYGSLANKFGSHFDLDIRTPGEAFRALFPQLKGLREIIEPGTWIIMRAAKGAGLSTGYSIGEEELELGLGEDDLYIMPRVEGAGDDGGTIKTIVGAVLVVVGVVMNIYGVPFGDQVVQAGLGMMFAGVAMMLAPSPDQNDPNDTRKQSFVFSGPANVSRQGHAVPLVYGEVRTGSVVVSSGVTTEKVHFVAPTNPGGFNPIGGGWRWEPIDTVSV